MKTKLYVMILSLAVVACGDGRHQAVRGASAPAGAASAGGAPGFAQVSAVFKKNCAACHPSKQPADWLDYATAKRYADNGLLVRRVVAEKSMPERGSAQAAAMTDEERQVVAAWVAAGAPKQAGAAPGKAAAVGGDSGAPPNPRYAAIQSCTSCHGTPPAGPSDPAVPRLNGQSEEYLRYQLQRFAHMERGHVEGTMNKIAAGMTEAERRAAAQAFALAPPPTDVATPPADRVAEFETGAKLAVQNCYMCHVGHNEDGRLSNHPLVPVLAGQSERYLRNQLYAYRSVARKHKLMNELAGQMNDEEIRAVSLFFSLSRPKSP